MLVDSQLLFDQAAEHLTTGVSTNIVDLGENRNIGVGEVLYLVAVVTTAFTDGGSDSTMTLNVETDNDEAFGSPTEDAQVLGTFGALAAAGARLVAKLQPDALLERYLRIEYTVANGNLTTGKFTVFIVKDIQAYTSYPDGFTIS